MLRYVGPTNTSKGKNKAGVELDAPVGKHNGTVNGRQYFRCRPPHGTLVPIDKIVLLQGPHADDVVKKRLASSEAKSSGNNTELVDSTTERKQSKLNKVCRAVFSLPITALPTPLVVQRLRCWVYVQATVIADIL